MSIEKDLAEIIKKTDGLIEISEAYTEELVRAIRNVFAFKSGFPPKEGYYDIKHKADDSDQCFVVCKGYFRGGSYYMDWDGDLIAIRKVVGWREVMDE